VVQPGQEDPRPQKSRELVLVKAALEHRARGAPPSWLAVDKDTFSGRMLERRSASHPDRGAGTAGRRAVLEVSCTIAEPEHAGRMNGAGSAFILHPPSSVPVQRTLTLVRAYRASGAGYGVGGTSSPS
jgi:hypothetical protein